MKSKMFEKETFIKSVKENVKNLYRKTLDEASQQEIYQAVANTVNGLQHKRRLTAKTQRWSITCQWNF